MDDDLPHIGEAGSEPHLAIAEVELPEPLEPAVILRGQGGDPPPGGLEAGLPAAQRLGIIRAKPNRIPQPQPGIADLLSQPGGRGLVAGIVGTVGGGGKCRERF